MTSEPQAVEVTVPAVRELATAWARDLDTIAQEMYAFLVARIPEATADEEIAGLTLASCASNVEAVLSMIRHGIPASATEAPVAALEHARRMAARGGGIDATLRFYRLGHAFFWERWSAAIVDAVADRDELVIALRETAAFVFDYIDSISARVGAEHIAERERRQRRAAIVRADVVRAVLAGEDIEVATAERALAHTLTGAQIAFLCWTSGDPAALERAAQAVAQALGPARPLILADGPAAVGGWVALAPEQEPDIVAAGAAAIAAEPEVHVALGDVGRGIDGFRRSRDQADRARRITMLAARRAPTLTTYADIALVDLLSRDLEAARGFVLAELGGLGADTPTAARARAALLAVGAPGGGIAAAARDLDVHRNTVLQRVHRAEELRGRGAHERPGELHAALLLAAMLGEAVLGRE